MRIDRDDNIWAVDKGFDMIIKFNQAGRLVWVFGRRKESAEEAEPWEHVNPPLGAEAPLPIARMNGFQARPPKTVIKQWLGDEQAQIVLEAPD